MCAIEMYARLQLEMIGYLLFGFGFGFSDCLSSIQQCTIFFIYFFFLAIQRWFFSSSFSFIFRHLKHYIFGKWQHEWTYNSDTATTDSLIRLNDLIQNEVAFSILSMNCRAADAKKNSSTAYSLKSRNEMYELNGCVCVLLVNWNRFSASDNMAKKTDRTKSGEGYLWYGSGNDAETADNRLKRKSSSVI